jgi:hypothetical protein
MYVCSPKVELFSVDLKLSHSTTSDPSVEPRSMLLKTNVPVDEVAKQREDAWNRSPATKPNINCFERVITQLYK